MTVGQVINLFLSHARRQDESSEAWAERCRVLRMFADKHGDKTVSRAIAGDLDDWVNAKVSWQSDWTRKRIISTVLRCFNWAEKGGRIAKNPFRGCSVREGDGGRDMTQDELQSLLRVAPPAFRRLLIALRQSGARPGELRKALWTHFDPQRRAIILTKHKTARTQRARKARVIVLTDCLLRLLDWLHRRRQPGQEHIFVNCWGRPWQTATLCKHMRELRRRSGLEESLKLYSARHAYGTNAILNMIDPFTVQELMGHASINTTQRYVHLANKTDHLLEGAAAAAGLRSREVKTVASPILVSPKESAVPESEKLRQVVERITGTLPQPIRQAASEASGPSLGSS
jgi:integrase